MIAYLLHKCPEGEREAIEERWMEDTGLYEQLQDVEAELLDAYAQGKLSADDRESVAKYLLGSPVQDRKLLFARALRNQFPAPARSRVGWLGMAAAAVILLLAGAVAWLAWQNPALRQRLSASANRARPVEAAVYVAQIPSGTTNRSSAAASLPEVRLPANAQVLRLELQIDPGDETKIFAASLGQEGRPVWNEQPIRAERRPFGFVASMWVPAAVLAPGEYQVQLSAAGALVDSYRFRLQREP